VEQHLPQQQRVLLLQAHDHLQHRGPAHVVLAEARRAALGLRVHGRQPHQPVQEGLRHLLRRRGLLLPELRVVRGVVPLSLDALRCVCRIAAWR